MKGLRRGPGRTLSPGLLADFYLWTWLKGLRPTARRGPHWPLPKEFLPLDLIEGITTSSHCPTRSLLTASIFTFGPDWRDYDKPARRKPSRLQPLFLPLDLIEGITTLKTIPRDRFVDSCIFTFGPDWRDYDIRLPDPYGTGDEIFTFGPDWRDYDSSKTSLSSKASFSNFYLWTWLKGLRRRILRPWQFPRQVHFYLWTWLKGLRRSYEPPMIEFTRSIFTFGPDWRDYDSRLSQEKPKNPKPIFTFGPDWRDYDARNFSIRSTGLSPYFYLWTWLKGLRPPGPEGTVGGYRLNFYLWTWLKGLRQDPESPVFPTAPY